MYYKIWENDYANQWSYPCIFNYLAANHTSVWSPLGNISISCCKQHVLITTYTVISIPRFDLHWVISLYLAANNTSWSPPCSTPCPLVSQTRYYPPWLRYRSRAPEQRMQMSRWCGKRPPLCACCLIWQRGVSFYHCLPHRICLLVVPERELFNWSIKLLNEHELNTFGVVKIIIRVAVNRSRSCIVRVCCACTTTFEVSLTF